MGEVGDDPGCDDVIVTPQRPSEVLRFLLSLGIFSELKVVTYIFVKSVEQSESYSCNIERSLVLFIFLYEWYCVAVDGKIGRGKWPESVGLNNGFFWEADLRAGACWMWVL